MKLFRIYNGILQFFRALQILKIISGYAIKEWYYRTRLGRRRLRRKKNILGGRTTAERLREAIEELGPTYIKFGQILADRPDLISDKFREELKKLQTNAFPLNDEEAIALIEDELGDNIENIFAEFDHRCIASASIGQVYQGRLKNGEDVVIKIQRPRIISKIKLDIYLMHFIAVRMVRNYPDLVAINVVGFVDEFEDKITKELDYSIEAANIKRFEYMFQNDSNIHIPRVYTQYTTKKLLIMEKIVGIAPDNIQKLKDEGYNLTTIATNGAHALLKMILEEGFFHADPHPGNVFILPGNIVSFIDFGMVGVLRPREMNFLSQFALGFVRRDTKSIAAALLSLCDVKFFDKKEDLEFRLDQILKQYGHLKIEDVDFSNVMQDCINVVVMFKLQIPSGIFMLAKALATLQKFAGNLDSTISLTPIIIPYAKRLIMHRFSPMKLATNIYDVLTDFTALVSSFPSTVNEILYKAKKGVIKMDVDINANNPVLKVFRNIAYRFVGSFLIIGLFVGSILLLVKDQHVIFGKVGFIISTFLLVIMLFRVLFFKKRYYPDEYD